MPASRKRKAAAVEDQQTSKQNRPAKAQKSISTYGTVGKAHTEDVDAKKSKATAKTAPVVPVAKADNKRKRSAVVEESDDEIAVAAAPQKKIISTPRNKRFKNAIPPTPQETPSRGTAALFDRLRIDANSRAIPSQLQSHKSALNTPPRTPTEEKDDIDLSFPPELEDLQDLYASFLASLSLYYAHNGASSPVEMGAFLPLVTKQWKKRRVTVEDLQRMLGLLQKDQQFSLQDYGKAGICLTKAQPRGRALKRAASYIDEEDLNRRFEDSLQKAWHSWQAITPKENRTAPAFVNQLPLVEITQHESVKKAAPVFARGQQRLADLKAAKVQAPQQTPEPTSTLPKTLQAPSNRGTALLDRILAKQSLASILPAGPTKEQLERKSALHRVEDVARILSLLAGAKERCSFSMPTLTQQLQQSLRNPISKEEVERCLALMANEITPGFVKVLQMGEVKGVVIARSLGVGLAELRQRVEQACA